MHLKQTCRAVLVAMLMMVAIHAKSQTLVWSDEFDQPKLNADKWTTEVGGSGFGNGELQYYTSGESNVFIGSKSNPSDTGYLVIEARRENYGVSPENRQFTSGRIHTAGKFNFKYGSIEARIKLPDLQNGLWPAFWMLGANYPTVGWPRSGEIDILEAGFRDDWQNNVANKKVNSTVHWFQDNYLELVPNAHELGWWGNASATNSTTIEGTLNDGFHNFKLTWTPAEMQAFVDGFHYYSFAIPESDANITEFNYPFYIIMNLAVGGSNFVGITDPNQITAPMPAQMEIDYVRVYANDSTETFQVTSLPRETGNFGVFTETMSVTNSLGGSPTIEVWSNLAGASSDAQEGTNVLSYTANPGNWFGMGIPTGANNLKNMQNFIDGQLHFHMKTTSTWPMSIGVISSANGNAQPSTQSKPVRLDPAGNEYGLVRDGQWHEVIIPFSAFGNIEFRSISHMFYLVGDNPSAPVTFAIDNIYWSDGTKITPENGDYVIYSDTHVGVDSFDLGVDGQFYIWEATLNAQSTAPAEGSQVLSYTHNNKGWFGAAFTASAMHNLTAFNNDDAKLVFSLKTADTSSPFYIGMKSGTRDGEGQKWIAFDPAQTPYGFQRNGTWQVVQIPMSDFSDAVNLMEVTQMFQLLGIGNISDIAIDNIYFSGGGTAEPDLGSNALPVANAGANLTVRPPADTVIIAGSATDSDGSIASYAWSVHSGPNAPYLSGDSTATLTASGLTEGTYVFRLTVTDDDGAADYDDVSVFVGSNIAPTANAGNDRTVSLPVDSVMVQGSGADVDGAIAAYQWSNESGPNTPTLYGSNTSQLSATGLVEGTYQFRLTVTDNEGATAFDLVTVVVTPNYPPSADAGENKTITLPTNSVSITGSATDTGFISSYLWTTLSGPSTPTLSGQSTTTVTASDLMVGSYVLQFTVTDNGGLSATDTVRITVNEAPVNLALLKTVTTSSVENGTTLGSYAVDGNIGTRWASAFSDPQWLYVDLGGHYEINRVKITWEAAYGKNYLVEISDDANSWTTLKTIVNNGTVVNDHTDISGIGRFVRIYGTVRATPYGYSIYELEVYGEQSDQPSAPVAFAGNDQTISLPATSASLTGSASDADGTIVAYEWTLVSGPNSPTLTGRYSSSLVVSDLVQGTYIFSFEVTDNDSLTATDEVTLTVTPRSNLALNKPVLFSSAESNGTLGAAANDGNMGTRWASAFFDPQWWYVDLRQIYAIEQVKIYWEGAYGKDYQIQVSDDASNWTTIKNIVGNNSTFNDHSDLSGAGRYVRMYGTARATPWGYSFWEFEVYGSEDVNAAPTVTIEGEDIVVNLPQTSLNLNGWASDSDGSISAYEWAMIEGPSTVTMAGDDTDTVSISGLAAGAYIFRLTVTDNDGATGYDDVHVFVNNAPVAYAGGDQTVGFPQDSLTLFGSAEDMDGEIYTYAWAQIDGPNEATLVNAATPTVRVEGMVPGVYAFRLTVSDNLGSTGSDEVVVLVGNGPQAPNLALFKPVTVSSTLSESTAAAYAVDADMTTKWNSVNSNPQWLYVDLEDYYALDSVKIVWSGGYGRNYTVQVSNDALSWRTIRSVTDNRKLVNVHTGLAGSGRFVRIYGTAKGSEYGYAIVELEVYGSPNTPAVVDAGADQNITLPTNSVTLTGSANDLDDAIIKYAWTMKSGPNTPVLNGANGLELNASGLVKGTYVFVFTATDSRHLPSSDQVTVIVNPAPLDNIALGKTTVVSSVAGAGSPGSAAVDGNYSTHWISNSSSKAWIYVDFGDTYVLNNLTLNWGSAYAYNYTIDISSNATTWTNIKTVRGNSSLVNRTSLNGTGRYLRIYCLAPGTNALGYSMAELEVYGKLAAALRLDVAQSQELSVEDEVQFYPNPVKDMLHVTGLKNGSEVMMVNVTGIPYRKVVINESIDVQDIPSGLYILDCLNGIRRKIIKE